MANGYAAQTAAAADPAFTTQVRGAIVKAAEDIYSEGAGVAGHALRAALATNVLRSPDTYVPSFAAALAATGADKTSTDATVQGAVGSVWNAVAGA